MVRAPLHKPDAPRQRMTVEWWQSGPDFRSAESFAQDSVPQAKDAIPSFRIDRVSKGGDLKTLEVRDAQAKGPKLKTGSIGDAESLVTPLSPWSWGLFYLQDAPPLTFADALQDANRVEHVEVDVSSGKRLVVASIATHANQSVRIWFDPAVNYLVRKRVNETTDRKRRFEFEVTAFRECKPGVFFPEKVVTREFADNKLTGTTTVDVTAHVNDPVDPSVFELRFPEGTSITDKATGVVYVTGPDGRPDPKYKSHPIPPPAKTQVKYPTGDHRENSDGWRRPIGWALAIGCLIVGVWVVLSRRKPSA
ncbi:MAG: hypothetical protein U0746_21350 [Gemmataceae bacterium]